MTEKWISRYYLPQMDTLVQKGKVLAIYGARRTGKTSLINKYLQSYQGKVFSGTGDDMQLRDLLSSENLHLIRSSFSQYDLVFIDEAQRIPKIGWGLKLLVDYNPDLKIIATGSASFELSGQLGEPLTGRMKSLMLYPIAMMELAKQEGQMVINQRLQEFLIFGNYPEVITQASFSAKSDYLFELRNANLLKDILELDNIRNATKLTDLLKLVAFQVGQELSLNELSNTLGIAKQTVERYLDLLEKTFIIVKISGFSRNLRKEVTKSAKYYFLDNGIRNALINNFNLFHTRNDVGQLWENFCVSERLKKQAYSGIHSSNHFWRTYDQQEIDWVEESAGHLNGFEFKWKKGKQVKAPIAWKNAYPEAHFMAITPDDLHGFVM